MNKLGHINQPPHPNFLPHKSLHNQHRGNVEAEAGAVVFVKEMEQEMVLASRQKSDRSQKGTRRGTAIDGGRYVSVRNRPVCHLK